MKRRTTASFQLTERFRVDVSLNAWPADNAYAHRWQVRVNISDNFKLATKVQGLINAVCDVARFVDRNDGGYGWKFSTNDKAHAERAFDALVLLLSIEGTPA